MYKKILPLLAGFFILLFSVASLSAEPLPRHALSLGDPPKYGPDFTHFDYVNPKAPKGGELRMEATGGFDSLNPYILKGVSASGLSLTFDTLTTASDDEPFAQYGLLAESITLADDLSWVRFTLRADAKFHDGSPVRASDVAFSFKTLVEKGQPFYARYYHDVKDVVVEDVLRVRFDFKHANNPELPLILGQLPILSEKDWEGHAFDQSGFRILMGSGPYRIESFEPGRRIRYKRNEDYWGKNLAVNRGQYNFDHISYEYFRDAAVSLEAFKAGYYDYKLENTAKIWSSQYKGKAFDEGLILKKEIPHKLPSGMQGFSMNTRRALFKNLKVRKALVFAFDFEWSNKALFYGLYARSTSFFTNSEMEARGLPSEEELFYLEPLREILPPEVFGEVPLPPVSDGSGFPRDALLFASRLLDEAGYPLKNGKRMTPEGRRFSFEILLYNDAFVRVSLPYVENLKRLGIEAKIRLVDPSQYVNRVRSFDFDMIVSVFPQSLSPGNEQRDFWSCAAASIPGSRNVIGICDPAVESLVESLASAPDRKSLIAACRSLDRVLRQGYYLVPNWYSAVFRIGYRNHIAMPENSPPYNLGILTWWDRRVE
ncbi:extracellular solute-binding protein [Desulfococcaceae bacterium OttesenSCG-928-F15]|nr:extracellular solute-binding protein [Desulfococcaceae bacterium OttesenSCG-928-F15]